MTDSSPFGVSTDAFSRFWADMLTKMAPPSAAAPFGEAQRTPSEQMLKQMRQSFFDAWEKSCQEFMGSEVFLESMKKTMDGALAFREQMNDFLTKAMEQGPLSARSDTDALAAAIRSLEDRVIGEVEELSKRVERIEQRVEDAASRGRRETGGAE